MKRPLLLKMLVIGFLAMVLVYALSKVQSLVTERSVRQDAVMHEIAATYAGAQRLWGPVLVLPFTEEILEKTTNNRKTETKLVSYHDSLFFFPSGLKLDGTLTAGEKHRGLFKALIYDLDASVDGRFELPARLPVPERKDRVKLSFQQPYFSLGIEDPRGLVAAPRLSVGGAVVQFDQGSGLAKFPLGLHASLPAIAGGNKIPFKISLRLRGTDQLSVVPLAGEMHAHLRSAWPHPSFGGRFLPAPQDQRVSASGFEADWNVTALSTSSQRQFANALNNSQSCGAGECLESFHVRLVEPVNIYSQSDGAVKYGFLFIWLTFGVFFFFEVLAQLRIHPTQYTFAGAAVTIFFLLLLSLSEHFQFGIAYSLAAAACVLLLTYYLGHVLGSFRRGSIFGAMLAALYGVLYGLLLSEDNALLLGSLLIFALLSIAMIAARRVNWYGLGDGLAQLYRHDTAVPTKKAT